MKKTIGTVITVLVCLTGIVLGFVLGGHSLSANQKDTLILLLIVCACSVLYCFLVGEIAGNNSQMDKLWSLLPIAYVWIIAIRGNMSARLVVFAAIVTLWGIRLTYNFGRKGAYRLKFWTGEEDYRWAVLRSRGPLKNRFLWAMFDLFFICLYQNLLVLATCLPALAVMDSPAAFGPVDYVSAALSLGFLVLETVADEQQWKFQETKKRLLKEGKTLNELPLPYSRGFNTIGLWGYMRHPNYLGEQGIWASLYLFVIGGGVASYGIFHWTILGPLLLILLFLGSATFGESISRGKYPEYPFYQQYVFAYLPIRKYDAEKASKRGKNAK